MALTEIPADLTFFDSTVRKILMTPGVRLDVQGMVEVAAQGKAAGLTHTFLNVMWWGSNGGPEPLPHATARAIRDQVDINITIFSDVFGQENWRESLETLIELRPDAVQVCVPLPDVAGLRPVEGSGPGLARFAEVHAVLRDAGIGVAAGVLDCARVQPGALEEFYGLAGQLGVDRLDLSDSSASYSLDAMRQGVKHARRALPGVPVTMHVHNDVGMGSAACLVAVLAGAHPDVSACGLSYRAGFAALEDVGAALEAHHGVETGLVWPEVQRLCARVSGLFDPDILRAVTGKQSFLKDGPRDVGNFLRTGVTPPLAVDSVLVSEGFGRETDYRWDRQTTASTAAVTALLESAGQEPGDDAVERAQEKLYAALEQIESYPFWLTPQQAQEVVRVQ